MPGRNIAGDWPMNSLGGRVFDLSGNDNAGSITGPIWSKGKYGPALKFDGTNDYVNFSNVLNTFYVNPYTVSISMNISSNVIAPVRNIFGKTNMTSGGGGFLIAQAGTSIGSNKIIVYHFDGVAPSPTFITTNTILLNKDIHLVVSWNGTTAAGSIKVYFNGIRQAGAEANYGTIAQVNGLNLHLGTPDAGSTNSIIGIIEKLQIMNRELLPSEIACLYREPFYRYSENRVVA